ncbi:PIN domain-like protein, partial [Phycomyces blakesleeanus]
MGIHGLSSFIQEHSSLGKHKSWNENDSEDSCFIVDGNAYVYHYALQCKTDWTYGGQYIIIADLVRSHVIALRQARITPVFLFDGALPQDKEATRIKRYRNYIEKVVSTFNSLKQINDSNKTGEENPEDAIQYWGDLYLIPPLTLEVVVQTLRELDVEVIMCRGEADGMVAELAEERDGYVVSKDSDMHVYPHLGKGYLPLDLFSIGKDPIVSGTLYQPQVLASFLRIDTSMLPLFGTLLGNDYFDIQMVRYPIMEWCSAHGFGLKSQSSAQWPKYVAEFLRTIVPKNGIDKEVIGAVVKELKPIILASSMNQRQEKADGLEQAIICSIERYDSTSPLI